MLSYRFGVHHIQDGRAKRRKLLRAANLKELVLTCQFDSQWAFPSAGSRLAQQSAGLGVGDTARYEASPWGCRAECDKLCSQECGGLERVSGLGGGRTWSSGVVRRASVYGCRSKIIH